MVKKLMANSDVVIESFTPGTMDRLGLGYEVAREANPAVIYCSISGFGQTGPYRGLPGYDVVAQAMCGIMMCTGHEDSPLVRVGASWIDMGAGMYTALAVLRALLERQESGPRPARGREPHGHGPVLDVAAHRPLFHERGFARAGGLGPGGLFPVPGVQGPRRLPVYRRLHRTLLVGALRHPVPGEPARRSPPLPPTRIGCKTVMT